MANNIDAVKKVQGEIDVVIKQLQEVIEKTVSISKASRTIDFSGLKTPQGVDEAIKKSNVNIEQLNALIKEQESLERKLISTIAKKTLIQESTAKAVAKENEELKILRREQRNQVKQVSELSTAYEKVNAQLNLQIREYQNLSVLQKQGNKLTDDQKKRLDSLSKSIQTNQKVLKDTDAEVGRFQRNVGNYAGSFNGLSVSIAQIAREAPAAAVSLNTFILGISNNIPMLQDELTKLIRTNKELVAEGKPTVSIFKSLTSALLSPQVLLAGLVTVFTLYNKQIFEFIKNATSGADAAGKFAENTKLINKQAQEMSSKTIPQFQVLVSIATNLNETEERRAAAINELNSKYPDFNANILKEGKNTDIVSNAIDGYILTLNKKAKAQAAMSLLQEKYNNLIIEEQNLEQRQQNILEAVNATRKLNNKELFETTEQAIEYVKSINEAVSESSLPQSMRGGTSPLQAMYNGINDQLEKTADVQAEIDDLMKIYIDNVQLSGSTSERALLKRSQAAATDLKTTEEQIEAAKKLSEAYQGIFGKDFASESLGEAVKNLDLLNPQSVQRFADALRNVESFEEPEIDLSGFDELQKRLNELMIVEGLKDVVDNDLKEGLNDLGELITQFTGVNGDKFLNFFDKIKNAGVDSFEDIAEVAEASFDLIGDVSNVFFANKIAGYQRDIEANNEYYATLLENENLTDSERERLELDRQQKESELRKKEQKEKEKAYKVQKALAIAEIAINLAKTISNINAAAAAIDAVTFGVGGSIYRAAKLPEAIGLAAAQTAVVLASPIPQFAEGGTMDKDGLMMINDHKSGRLEVVERDGKLLMTDKRNAIVEGKKGDIIHKDANQYLKGLSDNDILKDIDKHTFNANIQHQNYLYNKALSSKLTVDNKAQTDRIVNAINAKKYRFNVINNVSLKDDLRYLNRGDF
ncbi:structural protein [Tenacibaculum phage JQ]|nr:structural protein [Tenacibaculum phage JQ]